MVVVDQILAVPFKKLPKQLQVGKAQLPERYKALDPQGFGPGFSPVKGKKGCQRFGVDRQVKLPVALVVQEVRVVLVVGAEVGVLLVGQGPKLEPRFPGPVQKGLVGLQINPVPGPREVLRLPGGQVAGLFSVGFVLPQPQPDPFHPPKVGEVPKDLRVVVGLPEGPRIGLVEDLPVGFVAVGKVEPSKDFPFGAELEKQLTARPLAQGSGLGLALGLGNKDGFVRFQGRKKALGLLAPCALSRNAYANG